MKKFSGNKGFTLIEVIISIAIFGIVALVLLSVLTSGLNSIFGAGLKTKAEYVAQQAMEDGIIRNSSGVNSVNGPVKTVYTPVNSTPYFQISFTSGDIVSQKGNILDIQFDDGKRKVNLLTFVPK